MKILSGSNITKTLIALIVILGIIFIIVGERPRHKANVKNPVKQTAPNASKQNVQPDNTAPKVIGASQPTTTPKKTPAPEIIVTPEEMNKQKIPTQLVDGKKLITQKYQNSDKTFMQKAIEMHKEKKANELNNTLSKDDVDSEISEAGLAANAEKINADKKNESKIQEEEDVDATPVKSLTTLSEPEVKESSDINPAIIKEQDLEDKYPLRYSSSTAADTNTVYLIDTSTAQVSMLPDGNTYWINLGKPEGATTKPVSTYTLEGTTKNSAVVMDISTAESWRVTVSKDDIKWTLIQPFTTKD